MQNSIKVENQIQKQIKMIFYYDQVEFIPGFQRWFNIKQISKYDIAH